MKALHKKKIVYLRDRKYFVGFEVLTAVDNNVPIF
jgi:hypothetical protein